MLFLGSGNSAPQILTFDGYFRWYLIKLFTTASHGQAHSHNYVDATAFNIGWPNKPMLNNFQFPGDS